MRWPKKSQDMLLVGISKAEAGLNWLNRVEQGEEPRSRAEHAAGGQGRAEKGVGLAVEGRGCRPATLPSTGGL